MEQLNPHDVLIRQIAHDPNAQVMEDWDLILADKPSPLLVELVADPTCLLRSLFLNALYIAFEGDPSSWGPDHAEALAAAEVASDSSIQRWRRRVLDRETLRHPMIDDHDRWHEFAVWEVIEGYLPDCREFAPSRLPLREVMAADVDILEGRLDVAQGRADGAAKHREARPYALLVLAAIHETRGDLSQAVAQLARAVDAAEPRSRARGRALLHLGRVEHALGQDEAAIRHVRAADELTAEQGVDMSTRRKAQELLEAWDG